MAWDAMRRITRPKILFVDPNAFLQRQVLAASALYGQFDVDTANNSHDALQAVHAIRYSGIVMEANLKEETTGPAVARQIRIIDSTVPLAFYTQYDTDPVKDQARELGAILWVKPFEINELMHKIIWLVRERPMFDETLERRSRRVPTVYRRRLDDYIAAFHAAGV